jgi:hypothetical protein
MAQKRDELMDPVIEKLGEVIVGIAQEQSYDFILNAVDGSGTSIVLHGPESRDITKLALQRLGIPVPEAPAK